MKAKDREVLVFSGVPLHQWRAIAPGAVSPSFASVQSSAGTPLPVLRPAHPRLRARVENLVRQSSNSDRSLAECAAAERIAVSFPCALAQFEGRVSWPNLFADNRSEARQNTSMSFASISPDPVVQMAESSFNSSLFTWVENSMSQRSSFFAKNVVGVALALACLSADGTALQYDKVFADGFDPYGVLLGGPADRLAMDAIVAQPPVPVPESEIEDDVIMTRMDLYIDRGATVGQVNMALIAVGALIVTMTPGRAALTIAIPRAADLVALRTLRETLKTSPGILMAATAEVAAEEILPDLPAGDQANIGYLFASHFPAAWNTNRLATANCESRKVPVRFIDSFRVLPPDRAIAFDAQVPDFDLRTAPTSKPSFHGYEVVMTGVSRLDAGIQTGANPFPQCLNVQGADANGISWTQRASLAAIEDADPHYVMNLSLGNRRPCGSTCVPSNMDLQQPLEDAIRAIDWRAVTQAFDDRVIYVTAAGNDLDRPLALLYPYFEISDFASPMNLAASAEMFGADPNDDSDDFSFLRGPLFLEPTDANFPSLVPNESDVERIRTYARQNLAHGTVASPNTMVTGSATNSADASQTRASAFSDLGPTLHAVGEGVVTFVDDHGSGTSVAAPQIAGLASYLWLLSDELRAAPVSKTITAIVSNTRQINNANLADAYATVLSLDAADPATVIPSAGTMPMRFALLDVNNDGRFDEADIGEFTAHLIEKGGSDVQDWSRYDLNGDGYTGGFHADRFDLDRIGSTQFGAARYSTVSMSLDGSTHWFDENLLLDVEILCYYAYSPLYTGDAGARTAMIGGTCADPFGGAGDLLLGAYVGARKIVWGGSRAFAFGIFGPGATVSDFDFTTLGWSPYEWIVPTTDNALPVAVSANGGNSGAMVILESAFDYSTIWWRRFDVTTGMWTDEAPLDMGSFPRLTNSQIELALSASGSAVVVWKTPIEGGGWEVAASHFDQATSDWSEPGLVADAAYSASGDGALVPVADDAGSFYVNFPTLSRFDAGTNHWSAMEPFPDAFLFQLAPDHSGRVLGLGLNSSNQWISSRYDPTSGHWSDPLVLPDTQSGGLPRYMLPRPYALDYLGNGSEACSSPGLCVDAAGNALLLLRSTGFPYSVEALSFDAMSNQWRQLGTVGTGVGFSLGMGYQSGDADVAWVTDPHGSVLTRRIDRNAGLGVAEEIFNTANAAVLWYPPAVLHDEADKATVLWGAEAIIPPFTALLSKNYWRDLH